MKILKHSIPFLLSAIFFAGMFNYVFFVAFVASQKDQWRMSTLKEELKEEMQIEMRIQDLHKNTETILWHENNSEISINGQFYEVIKINTSGDNCIVHCVLDDHENSFNLKFKVATNKSNDLALCIIKMLSGKFYSPNFNSCNFSFNEEVMVYPSVSFFYDLDHSDQEMKPPRI